MCSGAFVRYAALAAQVTAQNPQRIALFGLREGKIFGNWWVVVLQVLYRVSKTGGDDLLRRRRP